MVEDNYVDPDRVNITFPEQKRNLIYLYLESMESTYADKASGGAFDKNYIPELTQLATDNISFSNSELLGGGQPTVNATWTIAGIFAQTSGLPLSIGIQRNEMAYYEWWGYEDEKLFSFAKDRLTEIGAANNLLAAMIDNHIFQGNALNIDPRKITWKRCVDMNDRQLREAL